MVTRRPSEEIARLDDEIYEREIQHEVEGVVHAGLGHGPEEDGGVAYGLSQEALAPPHRTHK